MRWSPKSSHLAFVFLAAAFGQECLAQSAPITLTSPDQRLTIEFTTIPQKGSSDFGGKLMYSVNFCGKPLLDQSALALELEGQPVLGDKVKIVEATPTKGSDDYRLVAGKVGKVHDEYSSVLLRTKEFDGLHRPMNIEARAYNDGVAFRY